MNPDDDAPPADPAASLRLIENERARAERDLTPDPRMFFWPWGFAWLLGFALFFLRYGPDDRVFVPLPGWLPLTGLFALMIAAGVLTGVFGARVSRDLRGPSSRQGAMYGIAWSVGFAGLSVVLARVTDALPDTDATLLWSGAMVALTGVLHMAGGAIWENRDMFVVGAWTSGVNVAGVLLGPGWHALLLAVLGGGGMLVAGFLGWKRLRS